ncbi:MAG: iron-containing alcohol dehydrogenase [Chloroflexi bacterium]|nr:iron-containing alcohol dehydrogenase [Chloroflexota bacterium]
MWYFSSPQVVFGREALTHLAMLQGQRAFIVTDQTMVSLGFVDKVVEQLQIAGIEHRVFAAVEPEPSLQTVQRGAQAMLDYAPDWIIGLGGGSAMDAAKAMWVLYEHPEMRPEEINPILPLSLRQKARLIAIPTTSGTGAEATWAIVLTDTEAQRKLGLGSRENMADIAIVDPELAAAMPPRLTASTGMDALTHAIEGYTSTWRNDFCDGLCLQATRLIFDWLPKAYADGSDLEAREKMHNAACIAGLGFGNSMAALAHALGHSLGAACHLPHGRCVGLFLPYTIEFAANAGGTRYAEIARFLGLPASSEAESAASLVAAIRQLARDIGEPLSLQEVGISSEELAAKMPRLVDYTANDATMACSTRSPSNQEIERLCEYAWAGKSIDF